VVVFPEGSRTYNGKMIRFKKGAYQMAADQHLQIVPITLNGHATGGSFRCRIIDKDKTCSPASSSHKRDFGNTGFCRSVR